MAGKPPIELSIEGDGLRALQRKLKAMEGGKLLQRELNKGLRDAAKPLIPDMRGAARRNLPRAGGLNERVADAPMRISVSASKREPGVKLIVKGVDVVSTNKGLLRHPVYQRAGRAAVWVLQKIAPGWFDDEAKQKGPKVRPHLLAAMERTVQKIANA